MEEKSAAMPHVLITPLPAQGHIRAMLKLAELLSAAGIYITFVNIEGLHSRRLLSSQSFSRPNFRFRTVPNVNVIPDCSLNDDIGMLHNFLNWGELFRTQRRECYRELLVPSNSQDSDEWPPVTCIVADATFLLAVDIAEEMDIPVMLLATNGPSSMLAHLCIPELVRRGEFPFPEAADMDEPVQGVAGMEAFLRRRDVPSSMRQAKSIDDRHLRFRMAISNNLVRASALILNTAEAIDSLVLRHIRSFCPVTYSPGPFDIVLKSINCKNDGGSSSTNSYSIFEEDSSCIAWLDLKPDKSVVYVSFGSLTIMTRKIFVEFWHGLVNSGRHFLWVIRPDMVEGGMQVDELMSPEVEGAERGYFVKWAPQQDVLAHRAVGCFLTHSGWNSTLESIITGVPMICWPFFTDQLIISRFVSEVWKIGVDMKDKCERSIIERMVRQVMDGESAEEFQRSANELAQMVRRDTEVGGSSYTNYTKLIHHIKSLRKQK